MLNSELGATASSYVVRTRSADVLSGQGLLYSSIAEPDTGEIVWVSGTFALGDKRIVRSTHRTSRCLNAGSRTIF